MENLNQKSFEKKLAVLDKSFDTDKQTLHSLAVFALHTVNVGKTVGVDSPIQKLWNVINKHKQLNRQAFMQWAQEFGMLRFAKAENSEDFVVKFADRTKKDPSFDPVAAVQLADGSPFWEFAKTPNPNMKPYNVLESMRNIIQQAKSAAMGGANGDKPKRPIEHAEMLDVISYILTNPDHTRNLLGLGKVSEMTKVIAEEVQPDRQELKAA